MAGTEVFKPADSGLAAQGGPGMGDVGDATCRPGGSRPSTQSGYRFGQLSHNSFFARHNPHPSRVRHIKGLLDLPICAVNDDGYFASHQHLLNFPPNNYVEQKMKANAGVPYNMPVSSINLARTQKFPLDTINGLQYFTRLQSQSLREKAVPRVGVVPLDEAWRDELRSLTLAAFMAGEQSPACPTVPAVAPQPPPVPATPRAMYSPSTGRLIPPPSRAMSRQASRAGSRARMPAFEHITMNPDRETHIFSMLCQILQTEDICAVQSWLVSASEQEKATVLSIIQSALGLKENYFHLQPNGQPRGTTPKVPEHLPPIPAGGGMLVGADANADRLTVHESPRGFPGAPHFGCEMPPDPDPFVQEQAPVPTFLGQMPDDVRPPTSSAFRPPTGAGACQPTPPQGAPVAPAAPATPAAQPSSGTPVLRYTKTPDLANGGRAGSATWNPMTATVKQ